IAIIQHMNIMMDEPGPVFRRIIRAVLGIDNGTWIERPNDSQILETAPGVYELPMPGPLTNFRPQTRTGRVHIQRQSKDLTFTSRWGKAKEGVPLTPCDPEDPAFFAIRSPGADASYLAFTRAEDGSVDGLR